MQLTGSMLDTLTNSMGIIRILFEGEERRLSKLLEELTASNDRLLKVGASTGFMFNGDFYKRNTKAKPPMHGERHALHETLWEPMMQYLQETSKLVLDINKINQMCHRLVKGCVTLNDLRDTLPECLVALTPELANLQRTRPEGWTLQGDERAMRQYGQVKPLIEFYSATRLMY